MSELPSSLEPSRWRLYADLAWGHCLLSIVTVRDTEHGDSIRIISARPATRRERRWYEKQAQEEVQRTAS